MAITTMCPLPTDFNPLLPIGPSRNIVFGSSADEVSTKERQKVKVRTYVAFAWLIMSLMDAHKGLQIIIINY